VAAALGLLIGRSALRGGYFLQLDAAFGPVPEHVHLGTQAPLELLLHVLGSHAGAAWLVGTLFLCAWAPMVLFRRSSWYVQGVTGLFGVLNPFVYERVVEGQWSVAGAAGALILWLAAFEELLRRRDATRAALLGAATLLVVVLDGHLVGPVLLLALGGVLASRPWRSPGLRRQLAVAFAAVAVLVGIAAIPFFSGAAGQYSSYAAVSRFGRADLIEFRSSSVAHLGLVPNLLALYGFWAERLDTFTLPRAGAPWWPITSGILVAAGVAGLCLARERRWLLAVGLLALLISASTATGVGLSAATDLIRHVPLAAAYREPEKFSAVWMTALVAGVGSLLERVPDRSRPSRSRTSRSRPSRSGPGRSGGPRPGLAVALVLLGALLLPTGAAVTAHLPDQLAPVTYPASWYRTAAFLRARVPESAAVLVLPWTEYETLPYTGNRLTANPARAFFPGDVVASNNPQIPGENLADYPSAHDIGELALSGAPGCGLARAARADGVHWVLVEDAPGGSGNAASLTACGFSVVEGAPLVGEIGVLHG
jgi:hypothetical protein